MSGQNQYILPSRWTVLVLVIICLTGCQSFSPEDRAPFFFVEHIHEAKTTFHVGKPRASQQKLHDSFTLTGETRRALAPPLSARVTFEVEVPEEPELRFSIAASTMGRSVLQGSVEFLVLVESGGGKQELAFSDTIRRSQPNRWFRRDIDLSPWAGSKIGLSFETKLASRHRPSAEPHILPLWGNPVLVSRGAPLTKPNLILISLDCLRADHVGAYGYERDTTPRIDAFSNEAVLFQTAIATSSYTLPTHASMLTGLPPSLHGVTVRTKIPSSVPYLPQLLAEAGYRVNGVVSATFLSQFFGFQRGFHTYSHMSGRAQQVVDEGLALLREGDGQNQFLFLHLYDPHWPYTPHRELIGRFGERPSDVSDLMHRVQKNSPPRSPSEINQVVNLYDAVLVYLDEELGRFFVELKRMKLYDQALIILTADHGEAFYEHGHWQHGQAKVQDGPGLYEEIIHVPLIVKWPGETFGLKIPHLVSQADICPTLLEAAGLKDSTGEWSTSLRHALQNAADAPSSRTAIAEFISLADEQGAAMQIVLRNQHQKYIANLRSSTVSELYTAEIQYEELYDLRTDPLERTNLVGEQVVSILRYRRALRAYLAEAEVQRLRHRGAKVTLDESSRKELRALGYIEK